MRASIQNKMEAFFGHCHTSLSDIDQQLMCSLRKIKMKVFANLFESNQKKEWFFWNVILYIICPINFTVFLKLFSRKNQCFCLFVSRNLLYLGMPISIHV